MTAHSRPEPRPEPQILKEARELVERIRTPEELRIGLGVQRQLNSELEAKVAALEAEVEKLRGVLMQVHDQALEFDSPPNLHGTNATDTERGWFEGHAKAWSQADEIVAPILFNPEAK